MRILQLSPQFPFPETNGGKVGIASTFRQLAKEAEVSFACYADSKPEDKYLKIASKYGHVILFEHSVKNSKLRILKSLFDSRALYLRKHENKNFVNQLLEYITKNPVDIIHADHTAMAPLALELKKVTGLPVGLRLHNVENLIWKRYYKQLSYYHPKRWYVYSQYKKLKKQEAEILQNGVDIAFPITDEDAKLAKIIAPKSNLITAAPGINLDEWTPLNIDRKKFHLVHATTYDWVHNVDALLWFIKNVMPSLKQKYPEIKFFLYGKNPPECFRKFGHLGVEAVGFVNDLKKPFSEAGIYISPLFVGGGIRIKILEALAMKIPVVASPIAAEGINKTKENGVKIAETESEFVDHISNIIENPDLIRMLGENGRNFVLENYNWEKSIKIISDSYKLLLKK
ncbi:glycosyltransferase family 4 protein [Candidatus Kapaibacterium sp.]